MAEKTTEISKKPLVKKKEAAAPSRTVMNFVHHKSAFNAKRVVPLLVVIVAAVAVFAKFGILDQMNKKVQAYSELSTRQAQLSATTAKLAGYDDLENEYGRYSYGWMSDAEVSLVERPEVLDLLEKVVMPKATVENFAVNSDVLTINLHGVTLNQASEIVKSLEENELVESAKVYNASASDGKEATILMSVVLTKGGSEE